MPAIHIIFKGWYSLIPEISHCYSTHPPQLYSPYSWNFRIVIPLSATIIQPIFLNFSHCYSTCLPQPYHMMSWDNWPPMPHLFRTFTQTNTNNIPTVFPQYSNPYSNPNLPPTNGKVDATPRWDPDYRRYSIYKRTTWNTTVWCTNKQEWPKKLNNLWCPNKPQPGPASYRTQTILYRTRKTLMATS